MDQKSLVGHIAGLITIEGNNPKVYSLRWVTRVWGLDTVSISISAASDTDALRQAVALASGERADLWQMARFVAHLNWDPNQSASVNV